MTHRVAWALTNSTMARNNHTQRILSDIQEMSPADLELHYGIVIRGDGTVWDDCAWSVFGSIEEWAADLAADSDEDNHGGRSSKGGKHRFDDEY